jgi:hypothetical protein
MWNSLNRLVWGDHLKGARDGIADSPGSGNTTSEMGRDQHLRSSASTFWHYGVGRQFECDNPIVGAECRNTVAVNEGSELGTSRGYLNTWTFGAGFVCHDDTLG